jgi:nickel transport protein
MTRVLGTIVTVCFLVCGFGGSLAHAHRVGVFCWVEGNKLHTQSTFQPGGPVKGGRLQIVIPATGEVLATGTTDFKGEYTFDIPAKALKEGLDFRVSLLAGSGHKGYWDVPAAEYMDGPGPGQESPVVPPKAKAPGLANPENASHTAGLNSISQEALQKLLDQELDRKFAPIKRSLAQMQVGRPSVSEVIGGIGYIFGIMGLVLYFKSKKSV